MGVRMRIPARLLVLFGLSAAFLGCPFLGGSPVALLVSQRVLDFGETRQVMTVSVRKSASTQDITSIQAAASHPWITILNCAEANNPACRSAGSLDPVNIRIGVDRSMASPGENEGRVTFTADGAAAGEVIVRADAPVVVNFTADRRAPVLGQRVTFRDASELEPGPGRITAWNWDFGDNSGSTQPNPPPHLYPRSGSFTVSLTITVEDGTSTRQFTTTREAFIRVLPVTAPALDFSASATRVPVNESVQFTNETVPGTFPIVEFLWNFGDGRGDASTSRLENPSHTYITPGVFDVTLTVTTADGTKATRQLQKENFIEVFNLPPDADFTLSDPTPLANQIVTLQDLSTPGTGRIVGRVWRVNGEIISTASNPTSVQTRFATLQTGPQTFEVSLTTTDQFGNQDTETRDILVTTAPPVADFTASRTRRSTTVEDIQFEDTSDLGSGLFEITREWNFGDGTPIVTGRAPTHRYDAPGVYSVTMTISTEHGEDTIRREGFIEIFEGTALDEYVVAPDDSFRFELANTIEAPQFGVTVHVIDLISQTWRQGDFGVGQSRWQHWLRIIRPDTVNSTTAMLFISGGNNTSLPPGIDSELQGLIQIAASTNSIVALLTQVPNQPLSFVDEPNPRFLGTGRREDEILALTFRQFLDEFQQTPNFDELPALLPMTKSAVRAMDAIQDFFDARRIEVNDFILSGASKRGWTTWLAAAADERVIGIAPLVFDFLNFQPQLEHHLSVYGFFSEALHDYVEANVLDEFVSTTKGAALSEAAQALIRIVDPFPYRDRIDFPKFLVNSTGDQFFLPDSARFYLDQLEGETRIKYVPNTNHSLGDPQQIINAIIPWYVTLLNGQRQPEFIFDILADNEIRVDPIDDASQVTLWLSSNGERDFRFDEFVNPDAPAWTPLVLNPGIDGRFRGTVSRPVNSFNAFFLEVQFQAGVIFPGNFLNYTFTTPVSIAPDVTNPETPVLPVADFVASPLVVPFGTPVQFVDQSNGVIRPIILRVWNFGDPGSGLANVTDETNPTHVFSTTGTFTVSLTVTTVHGSTTEERVDLITVQ